MSAHQWRRLRSSRRARAPHFYKWLGTGSTVSRRTASKKLTELYWRSPKRLIMLVEPEKVEGMTFFWRFTPDVCPHFRLRSGATAAHQRLKSGPGMLRPPTAWICSWWAETACRWSADTTRPDPSWPSLDVSKSNAATVRSQPSSPFVNSSVHIIQSSVVAASVSVFRYSARIPDGPTRTSPLLYYK